MSPGPLHFIKDMVNKRLSCSSVASTSVVTTASSSVSDSGKKKKKKQEIRNSKQKPRLLVSPASSSRFLLNSSRLRQHQHQHQPDLIDMEILPAPASPSPAVAIGSGGDLLKRFYDDDDDDDDEPEVAMPVIRSCSTKTQAQEEKQVVALRVSLHCKGCAGKLRKHISKMQGVTSFHIDVATKKVTVVGDVTPLAVLTAVSKIKPAQFWPSPPRASASF